MAGKFSKLFDFLKSKEKPKENESKEDILQEERITKSNVEPKIPVERHFHGDYTPQRKIFLWGWDQDHNPSFLVLYGRHQFIGTSYSETRLEENVKYTDYAIFRGCKGHFPSFEAVKIVSQYNYRTKKTNKNMYYKKDTRRVDYWNVLDPASAVKDYGIFKEQQVLSFSYFEEWKQEDYVKEIRAKNLSFPNFRLADTIEEVLGLGDNLSKYTASFSIIMGNPNLYLRKKHLKEILNSKPSKELYDYILKAGSNELVSGLFLELGLLQNDVLLPEAQNIISTNVGWVQGTYLNGLKRCASLYINSLDAKQKEKRIHFIQENLPDMDLHIENDRSGPVSKEKELGGSNYREYARNGVLSEYYLEYSRKERKYIRKRSSDTYKVSHYSDGVSLNIVNLKQTIQEGEMYELPGIIGKITYYLDAPRLVYYFRANSNTKSLLYFRRYVKRIIDSYVNYNEKFYVEAMKELFTSYTNADYLSKFQGDFQRNYFIKYYLYHDADMEYRAELGGVNSWIGIEGRYERNKKIWDNHLEDVIDILLHTEVPVILKAFYFILKDSGQIASLTETLSYEKLIRISTCSYQPAAQMFIGIMRQRIECETVFSIHTMLLFMKSSDKGIQGIATEYFNKTNGKFSVENLEPFLFLSNLEEWSEVFELGITALSEEEYLEFLHVIVNNIERFTAQRIEFSENLNEILNRSLDKLKGVSQIQISKIISAIMTKLASDCEIPDFIFSFTEALIFSNPFKEIQGIAQGLEYEKGMNVLSQNRYRMISFLNAIKEQKIPLDSQIMEILELGSTRMVKTLIGMISECREQLSIRFSTLLIMLESDVTALNELAKAVFETLQEEKQKELHFIIIDSPDQRVYSYGLQKLYEIYEAPGACIPEEFMIQMLEHSSSEVKSYISNKISEIIKNLGNGKKELFMYYVKTLLFLPNKVSAVKDNIYEILPTFVSQYRDKQSDVEDILFDLGGSNIIKDSERALVALAKIKKEAI